MAIKKYRDWKGWWDGMRSKAFKAGAESLTTNIGALIGTNGVASMGIPGLSDLGMNWKTAIFTCLLQFALRVGYSAALYVQNKPDPDMITETVETTHITRNEAAGTVETGSSKTVTTTPIESQKP